MTLDFEAALKIVRPCSDYYTDSGCEDCAAAMARATAQGNKDDDEDVVEPDDLDMKDCDDAQDGFLPPHAFGPEEQR